MKKLIVILTVAMLIVLSGCSTKNESSVEEAVEETSPEKSGRIADDCNIRSMNITAPAEFISCSRFSEYDKDGKFIEKDIVYNLSGKELITFSAAADTKIADLTDPAKLESREVNGAVYYLYRSDKIIVAMHEEGNDLMLVEMEFENEISEERFFAVLDGVTYSENSSNITDDPQIKGLIYSDDDSAVRKYSITLEEDKDGNFRSKSVIRFYGGDGRDYDYRIVAALIAGSTIAKEAGEDDTVEEITVNGITYQAYNKAAASEPYAYYYQAGDDVYSIRNAGKSGFLSADRSEESFTAFHEFLNNVTFE